MLVVDGWLNMSYKRKLTELKTADEEKALSEKSVPKSAWYTPYSKMAANKLFFCLHVN